MPGKSSLEQKLAEISRIGSVPEPEALPALREALRSPHNALAARAAALAAGRALTALIPDLLAAFDRFMEDPLRTDKGCRAKRAIVEALNALAHTDPAPYLRGIRHVQREPVFGGRADTADALRAQCAFALVRLGYRDVLFELVTLLADREAPARRAAVQALAHIEADASELLLRHKALAGDADPDVTGECLSGLMKLAPARSAEFVARFLAAEDRITAESAALALGNSGYAGAFDLLRARWEQSIDPAFKQMLLLPMALTRRDEAVAFLLELIATAHTATAAKAVDALRIYGADPRRREAVERAVSERDESAITNVFEKRFEAER